MKITCAEHVDTHGKPRKNQKKRGISTLPFSFAYRLENHDPAMLARL